MSLFLTAVVVVVLFCDDAVPTVVVVLVEWLDNEEIFEFEFPAIIFEEVVLLVIV